MRMRQMLDFEHLVTYDVTRAEEGVWGWGVEDTLISEVVDKSGPPCLPSHPALANRV
jgi:hypothetical protein